MSNIRYLAEFLGDEPVSSTAAPTTVAPTTLAPTTLGPTTLAPTTLPSTTLAPTTVGPTTLAPTTLAPTTLAPTTLAPTTLAPTTIAPTTIAPTTLVPTTPAPPTLVRINGEYCNILTQSDANWAGLSYRWVDGDIASAATAGISGEPRWYQQELPKPYTVKKIRIYSTGVNTRDIKSFKVKGSNTGAFGGEEDLLLTVTNQTGWSNEWREWDIPNSTAYKFIRLTDIYGNNSFWMNFYEMELLAPSSEVDSFGPDETGSATMTAKTGNPYLCTDDDLGTYWSTATTVDWLQAYWAGGKIINKVTMQPTTVNKYRAPDAFTLKASMTGVWGGEEVTLLTVSGCQYDHGNEVHTWQFANAVAYKYYRFDPISTLGVAYIYLAELQMMEGIETTTAVPTTSAPTVAPTTVLVTTAVPTTWFPTTIIYTTPVPTTAPPAADTVCWGQDTGVVEFYIKNLVTWTGTGLVLGTGDNERLQLLFGQQKISPVHFLGIGATRIKLNKYLSGNAVFIQYKTGATPAACDSDVWHSYVPGFMSLGYVRVRLLR